MSVDNEDLQNIIHDKNDESKSLAETITNNNRSMSDKPDFLSKPVLMTKTTTEVDKNPVHSDISIPINIKPDSDADNKNDIANSIDIQDNISSPLLETTEPSQDLRLLHSELAVSSPILESASVTPVAIQKNASSSMLERNNDNTRQLSRHNTKSLKFSVANDSLLKRTSTYASRSTVRAIPINNNNSSHNILDYEDVNSSHSRSSSMTASFSRNFLFGFYNDNKKYKQRDKKNIISKEYWMKDETARECFNCGKTFNTFRRKHHCRICGQIFCNSCTSLISGDRFGYESKMRVCYNCYEHVCNYEDSSDEEEEEEEEGGGEVEDAKSCSTIANDKRSSGTDDLGRKIRDTEGTTSAIWQNTPTNHESIPSEDSDSQSRPKNEVLFFKNDDVQSIMTSGEDSKLFVSTPPPPPKMAIPATKQGESLEISFSSNSTLKKDLNPSHTNGKTRDSYTLKDFDIYSPYSEHTGSPQSHKHSHYSDPYQQSIKHHHHSKNQNHKTSVNSLRKSIFHYVSNGKSQIPHDKNNFLSLSPNSQANNILSNLNNKNFQFQFNFGKNKDITSYTAPGSESLDDSLEDGTFEDEGTMSLYSSLHDPLKTDNPIRSTRNSTKSFQRAQASLHRIQSRRRSKSKSTLGTSSTIYRGINALTHSSPNLLSVVSDDTSSGSNTPDLGASTNSNTNALVNSKSVSSTMKPNLGKLNQWRRLTSISGTKSYKEDRNELNEVAMLHMNELLRQVLDDQAVEEAEEWMALFNNQLLKKVQHITLNARDSNTLDYRQKYVKIKRICGGTVQQSEFIDGIVFSKGVPGKDVPRRVENPRILLVMFPLEYQKNENHFLSIESVRAQEREYIDKLISRVTSINPDIIYVGANVSGYALQLLNKAGIVVQFNLKPQVIERIARLTEADIAITVDKLASNVKMGECELFEVKTFIYGNISKTYTFLRGCNSTLGCTILLRGGSPETLKKIKHLAEFMVYVVFSLKLESSFFNDNFIKLSPEFYMESKERKENQEFSGYFSDFLQKFNKRILTTSATVEFPIPFLLKKARELEGVIWHKKQQNEISNNSDIALDTPEIQQLGIDSTLTFRDIKYIAKFVRQKELEDLELQFNRRGRQWELYYSSSHNMLGTGSHQSITVLYSMVSTQTATPCIGPQLVTIDYFWDSDISIGQFIENIINTARYPCQQGCGGLLHDHYRSYVHGSGKVDVLIEKLQTKLPKLKNIILTWSYCKKCGTSTPILQISERTWNYSFGKYLEVMFWSKEGGVSNIGNCIHDFTKDHVKYFGYNELVVRMEYSHLDVYDLITPLPKIKWKPDLDIKMKVELYYQILDKINSFYDSVTSRLNRMKLDGMADDRLVAGQLKVEELKQKVSEERKLLLDDLDARYYGYGGDKHLQLNNLIRNLYNFAINWDNEFNQFGKNFLLSENDISRITTNQLRKFFKDPSKDENLEEKYISGDDKTTTRIKTEASCSGDASKSVPLSDIESSRASKEQPKGGMKNSVIPNRNEETSIKPPKDNLPNNIISNIRPEATKAISSHSLDRVSLQKDLDRFSMKSSASSPSIKERNRKNKVSELALFFDQIHFDALSKEFELERELERLQLNKNKYQAFKSQTATPIVEIYKNVKDAVDEPLHEVQENGESKGESTIDITSPTGEQSTNLSLNRNLENELENSITQWGKDYFQRTREHSSDEKDSTITSAKQEGIPSEPLPPVITVENVNKESSEPPEKSLLMKTLANFWADRSPYLWKPLAYPTTSTEHVFSGNEVIIRDDEPSSLIAFCLNSSDYKSRMFKIEAKTQVQPDITENGQQSPLLEQHSLENAVQPLEQSNNELLKDNANILSSKESLSHAHESSKNDPEMLENIMTKKTALHLRYQFEDRLTVMSCKVFFSEHFEAFRRICGCDESFIQSLSRCVKWDSSGGKSGSGFLKTLDDRFVIKELSHSELDAFIKFAPSYFEYMAQAMFHDLPTALAKVFGFYQIQVRGPITGSKSYKMDVIIMENLFYNRKTTRIFDLKGSMRNRHVEQTGKANEVLLDENMVEYIYESPIHVKEYDKKLLRASLWNDTLFLAKMNVMDYSLVIGIDNEDYKLTVGIIDFIRTFTWDKKLESWVKEKGLVGGGRNIVKQPTVVTPRQYKNRFREAMERYILMVPDPWYQESN
ncbi:hypothetical protein KAFR_0C04440 [Kazachstania africana CBS 2517]|uniref:1-phosphatidylinositol-3-phosphate 5-kinase n=1 Tax=Kazachstania africana (strain ATCC 22294 / BCRC 22015 / CBS 2517 / CECT 1963 / NBRC 1671 / NRRL Y-8276) TaxID=1071382 RepID=H2AST4_KAZAF|nr:hypothetical protein KAFR_0C04440 [Kazachstania africana CBS 2517]CCF57434.1 hypothetical protein KAFR_0C04440 [Kazachstania africana CBS 2517]